MRELPPRAAARDAESYYPLHVRICDACWLVQLPKFVSPAHIFTEYAYFSSYSTSWVAHAKGYCEMIGSRLDLRPNSLRRRAWQQRRLSPATFSRARSAGPWHRARRQRGRAASARGVPTRVPSSAPGGKTGCRGARPRGLDRRQQRSGASARNSTISSPAWPSSGAGGGITYRGPASRAADRGEPVRHDLPRALLVFLARHRRADRGGQRSRADRRRRCCRHMADPCASISLPRVAAPNLGSGSPNLIAAGAPRRPRSLSAYADFADRVRAHQARPALGPDRRQGSGKRICGYGAPGKGNTLLNYCGIGPDFLDFTVDRNPYKHGLYTPGHASPDQAGRGDRRRQPDYILILPWNLKQEIVEQMRHVGDMGRQVHRPDTRSLRSSIRA